MSAIIISEPSAQIPREKLVSWGAIFSGVFVSLVTAVLFNMLGISLGLVGLQVDIGIASSLGIIAMIWLLLSGIISMLIGGWFTGRFSTQNHALQALVTWSVVVIINFTMVFGALGSFISGAGGLLQRAGSIRIPERSNGLKNNADQSNAPEHPKESLKNKKESLKNKMDQHMQNTQTDTAKMRKEGEKFMIRLVGGAVIIITLELLLSGIAAYTGGRLAAKRSPFKG